MEQTVRLLDGLGERYGTVHTYSNLRSPADAIKLLCLNSPAFQKELLEAHKDGVGYQVVQGGRAIAGYEDLALPFGSKDLYIVPVVIGSGGNTGKSLGFIALGVGLIAFSIITAGAGAGFMGLGQGLGFLGGPLAPAIATQMFAGANIVSAIAGGIGLSMALQGVTSLIAPQPQLPKPSGTGRFETRAGGSADNIRATGARGLSRATNQEQSYLYTGARNSSGPGAIVPVVFGKALVGSHLLSLDVIVQDTTNSGYVTQVTRGGPSEVYIRNDRITNEYEPLGGDLRTRMVKDDDLTPHNGHTGLKEELDSSEGGNIYHEIVKQTKVIEFDSTNKSLVKGVSHTLNQNRAYGTRDDKSDHQWKTRNWEIVLRLPNGLFDFASRNANPKENAMPGGEAKQPASIDYTVELRAAGRSFNDDEPVVGRIRATLTAQLDASYPSDGFKNGFTWVHSFAYQEITNIVQGTNKKRDNFRIKPILTINDFSVAGKDYFKLQVVQTGYKNVQPHNNNKTDNDQNVEHDSEGKLRERKNQFDFL